MGRATPRELPKNVGRYEVVRPLGVGAMGRVLLARDPVLERHVAIKLLRDDLTIGGDVRDSLFVRMRHEARAAARVTHPNLVVIHDMGEDEDLGLYLVFEYIEGPTLKQRLAEGRLSARSAARIARELGAALTYAHERGVLHRDVKPENIILSPTGTKLTDFGIARVPDSTLTHAGGLMGTPAYSAPETFREGSFSPESDQFSLAATLYEAIRGARAFPGDDAVSVASRIATSEPEAFAASLRYPGELDTILARGLSKDPKQRFESCKELGTQLMDALLVGAHTPRSQEALDPARRDRPSGGDATEESIFPAARLSAASAQPSYPPFVPRERRGFQYFVIGLIGLLIAGFIVRTAFKSPAEGQTVRAATTNDEAADAGVTSEPTVATSAPPVSKPPRRRLDPPPPKPSTAPVPPPSASAPEPDPSDKPRAPVPSATVSAAPSASSSAKPAPH